MLFDKAWYGHWSWSLTNLLLVISCGWLMAHPRSVGALLVSAAAQVMDWFSDQTILSNHGIIMALVNSAIMVTACWQLGTRTWRDVTASTVLTVASPAIRLSVLVIYLWATFHKLNVDFFSLEHGCVAFIATDLRNRPWPLALLPVSPFWIKVGIIGTLVVECLIPLLLAFRPTRGAGALIGIWFHSFLSSGPRNGFSIFSVVVFPLLWLFVSEESMQRLVTLCRRFFPGDFALSWATAVRIAGVVILAAVSLGASRLQISRTFPAWITYDVVVLWWSFTELRHGISKLGDCRSAFFRCANPALLVIPLVVFINGACPYLGLKTESSFAMLSNLRTEGGQTNHLLIPPGFAPFNFQNDLVEVLESSDSELQAIASSGKLLTWFDLRRRAWINPSMSLSFKRGGALLEIPTVRDRPDLVPPVPWWVGRLMPFRPIKREGPRGCDH